ncbi:MAG: OsmC family protein [Gemmatimonadota bacterium]
MSPPEVAPPNPVKRVRLDWTGRADVYEGSGAGAAIVIDGSGQEGPSPMDALLLALSGCMAIDVRMILEKSRVRLDRLHVDAVGTRAEKPPRRFLQIDLTYRLAGPAAEDRPKVERAVQLSLDTYCSVLHSLAPDTRINTRIDVEESAGEGS